MAPHSSTFAWKIPWMEEPGGLQSMRSLESDTTERLHFHFSLSCIGEGNGNPLQCSCLENPREGGAWWAAVYGVAQSRTRLKRLSSSSSKYKSHYHNIQRMQSAKTYFSFFPYAWNKLTSQGSISPTDLKMNFVNSWCVENFHFQWILSFRILLSVFFFLKLCSKVFLLSWQEWKAMFLLVAFGLDCLLVKFIYFAPAKLSEELTFSPCWPGSHFGWSCSSQTLP